MKTFLLVALTVAALFIWQWRSNHTDASVEKITLVTPSPTPTPAATVHSWVKRSIDRAQEVANQVKAHSVEEVPDN